MEQTRKNTDTAFTISGRLLASCAVAYMVLPTILFLLGWVRPLSVSYTHLTLPTN